MIPMLYKGEAGDRISVGWYRAGHLHKGVEEGLSQRVAYNYEKEVREGSPIRETAGEAGSCWVCMKNGRMAEAKGLVEDQREREKQMRSEKRQLSNQVEPHGQWWEKPLGDFEHCIWLTCKGSFYLHYRE